MFKSIIIFESQIFTKSWRIMQNNAELVNEQSAILITFLKLF